MGTSVNISAHSILTLSQDGQGPHLSDSLETKPKAPPGLPQELGLCSSPFLQKN